MSKNGPYNLVVGDVLTPPVNGVIWYPYIPITNIRIEAIGADWVVCRTMEADHINNTPYVATGEVHEELIKQCWRLTGRIEIPELLCPFKDEECHWIKKEE